MVIGLSVCLSVNSSVRLSVHMKQLDSYWTDFNKIWYLKIFRIYFEKIQTTKIWQESRVLYMKT